ncbi:MAG: HAD-IA family hydrolase [Nitrospirota bacterium]
MLKLLIFDLDGTLADTSVDIANAVNYAIEPLGKSSYSVEEIKAMVGSGITKLIRSLIPSEASIPEENIIKRFLDYYSEHLLDNTKAYPYVNDTLSKFADYKKAVISNKREGFSREILEGIGISRFFDIVLGSDSVREQKPSPVPLLEVMKRYGASKDEAVMIGDSSYDIQAARAAGVKVIAVTYGFRSRETLKDADYIIDSFDELLKIIP